MKKMIYNVFDGLVMLMMVAAYINALIIQPNIKSFALMGLFVLGGIWLWIGQEVRQRADCD